MEEKDKFELSRAENGKDLDVVSIHLYGPVQLARLKTGEMIALNYRSENPVRLPNRELRSCWARCNGYTAKEVELYVRRRRDQEKRDSLRSEIEIAVELLKHHGYEVQAKGAIKQ